MTRPLVIAATAPCARGTYSAQYCSICVSLVVRGGRGRSARRSRRGRSTRAGVAADVEHVEAARAPARSARGTSARRGVRTRGSRGSRRRGATTSDGVPRPGLRPAARARAGRGRTARRSSRRRGTACRSGRRRGTRRTNASSSSVGRDRGEPGRPDLPQLGPGLRLTARGDELGRLDRPRQAARDHAVERRFPRAGLGRLACRRPSAVSGTSSGATGRPRRRSTPRLRAASGRSGGAPLTLGDDSASSRSASGWRAEDERRHAATRGTRRARSRIRSSARRARPRRRARPGTAAIASRFFPSR